MDFGVVGPRVVLRVVFERTRSYIVDGDRDGGRGRTARIVRPNRVRGGRRLHDRWNTPNRSVARAEVQACLLYTSPSPRDLSTSRMPSSA